MKSLFQSSLLAAVLLAGGSVLGQDKPTDVNRARPTPIPRQPIKIAPPDAAQNDSRPVLVTRPELVRTDELKQLIERFQAARLNYLVQQKALMEQLGEATTEQREELRDKLRENLEQWRDMQIEFRSQLKERAQELRDRLSSDLGRVVNDAKEEGSGGRPRD
ncbi:MAG TPA: hypothetical protein DCY13_15165 [Verrucomicrobiales bacterium]|nr:hypothetical protein [Verrucomicrobiales bacterium]